VGPTLQEASAASVAIAQAQSALAGRELFMTATLDQTQLNANGWIVKIS
jgi:hypothetical protein